MSTVSVTVGHCVPCGEQTDNLCQSHCAGSGLNPSIQQATCHHMWPHLQKPGLCLQCLGKSFYSYITNRHPWTSGERMREVCGTPCQADTGHLPRASRQVATASSCSASLRTFWPSSGKGWDCMQRDQSRWPLETGPPPTAEQL